MAKKEESKTDTTEIKTDITEIITDTLETDADATKRKQVCGIIMPISAIDGCSREHWGEVKNIISEAICASGYEPKLVSDADDSGIIQERIIQNIYNNDIVVCDVSGKNPNVMFELGMRLAFDKPTIIIIDDKTGYSFDTSPIEHLSYPRDLKYYDILRFKEELKAKIVATVKRAKDDPNYTTFLKHFGEFEVAHVEKKEGSLNDVVLSRISDLSYQIYRLEKRFNMSENNIINFSDSDRIEKLIRLRIEEFCADRDVPIKIIKEEPALWTDRLFKFMEESEELRLLCRTPDRLRLFLNSVISQL